MKNFTFLKSWKLISIFLTTISFAQNISKNNYDLNSNESFYKTISFGEKISFGEIENNMIWTLINLEANININLSGNEINNFVFNKAGIYEIKHSDNKIHLKTECHEEHFPEKMLINVSPIKMKFDFSNISFSKNIQIGENQNIIISVPIKIENIANKNNVFNSPQIQVAGIGQDLKVIPIYKDLKLENGNQVLKYELSGNVKYATYLMFDFIDCNNQVQTYNLLQKIN